MGHRPALIVLNYSTDSKAERTTGALLPPVSVCTSCYHVHVDLYAVGVTREPGVSFSHQICGIHSVSSRSNYLLFINESCVNVSGYIRHTSTHTEPHFSTQSTAVGLYTVKQQVHDCNWSNPATSPEATALPLGCSTVRSVLEMSLCLANMHCIWNIAGYKINLPVMINF